MINFAGNTYVHILSEEIQIVRSINKNKKGRNKICKKNYKKREMKRNKNLCHVQQWILINLLQTDCFTTLSCCQYDWWTEQKTFKQSVGKSVNMTVESYIYKEPHNLAFEIWELKSFFFLFFFFSASSNATIFHHLHV